MGWGECVIVDMLLSEALVVSGRIGWMMGLRWAMNVRLLLLSLLYRKSFSVTVSFDSVPTASILLRCPVCIRQLPTCSRDLHLPEPSLHETL